LANFFALQRSGFLTRILELSPDEACVPITVHLSYHTATPNPSGHFSPPVITHLSPVSGCLHIFLPLSCCK
jgi:hypothetical protein